MADLLTDAPQVKPKPKPKSHRRTIFVAVAVTLVLAGWLATEWLPSFLLNLVQHPDSSYLSALIRKHQLKNPAEHTAEFYAVFIPAVFRRLLLAGFAIVAVGVALFTIGLKQLHEFWNHSATPFTLAVVRIVALAQLSLSNFDSIAVLSHLSPDGMNLFWGYGWLRPFMPPSAQAVTIGIYLFKVSMLLSLIGLWARWMLPLATVVSFFMLLGPQFIGKIYHYHHIWLTLAILAISPCADALSVDAWWQKRRGRKLNIHQPQLKYGRPLIFMWMTIAAIYFFPGFWKFVVSGTEWFTTDNVQLKILAKIFESGVEPPLALYNYPLLCKLGGFATMAFETLFPLAILFPATRLLFAFGGIGFHEINRVVMQIPFDSMKVLYVCFFNWTWVWYLGRPPALATLRAPIAKGKNLLWSAIVGGLVITGFLNIDSWPFAVYPTFAAKEENFVSSIEMLIRQPNTADRHVLMQTDADIVRSYIDRTRLRAHLTTVLLQTNKDVQHKMLTELLGTWTEHNPIPKDAHVEFWQVEVPLLPLNSAPRPFQKLFEI